MAIKLKLIGGFHATAHDRKVVATMLEKQWRYAKTPRKHFETLSMGPGTIKVLVRSREIDWFGSKEVRSTLEFQITYPKQ